MLCITANRADTFYTGGVTPMTGVPRFLIVPDVSALLASKTRDWQSFSRVGDCLIPKVVLEEMQVLCNRSYEPEVEKTAREFAHFYPESGWQSTGITAAHPGLQPPEGHGLSKKLRLVTSVLQGAYAIARHNPDDLVILVADNAAMLQRLKQLEMPNLCGLPVTTLLQWMRSRHRPIEVNHQLATLRSSAVAAASTTRYTANRSPSHRLATHRPSASRVAGRSPAALASSRPSSADPVQWDARKSRRPLQLSPLVVNLLQLLMAAAIGLVIWRLMAPTSFARFWQQIPVVGESSPPKALPTKK